MRLYTYSLVAAATILTTLPAFAAEASGDFYGWKGTVNADYANSSGNSDNWSVAGGVKATRDWQKWNLTLGAKGRTSSSDGERDAENYAFLGEAHRKLSDKAFLFAQGDYVIDNFSGYDYQATETVGYGRKLYADDTKQLDAKFGLGGRQSETEDRLTNSEVVLRPSLAFNWDITDTLAFQQDVASTVGEDYTVTEGTSKLKNALADNLFLQASYTFKHTSEVPADRKKLDTYTAIGLAYEF